jgi:PhoH-like ATPase
MTENRRIYVLDTNVLMHDPSALFRFKKHDVFLPMIVLEEMDAAKKGMSEVARNVRQASRFLNEMIEHRCNGDSIADGLSLANPDWLNLAGQSSSGRLWFQTNGYESRGELPDNQILSATLELIRQHEESDVVLVSKDINLRIKATITAGRFLAGRRRSEILDRGR